MIEIRQEQTSDISEVRQVNLDAFPTPAEADLVDALREQASPQISLVATHDDAVIGHIMFSPVTLLEGETPIRMMGLAPMAVMSAHQGKGIGSQLVERGLQYCEAEGIKAVVVLGHPNYYPRFGFVPSEQFGIKSTYDVPAEVFMAKELHPGALENIKGTVKYHACFDEL